MPYIESHRPISTGREAMRPCLGVLADGKYCGRMFWSRGPGNRICPTCAKGTSGVSKIAGEFIGNGSRRKMKQEAV